MFLSLDANAQEQRQSFSWNYLVDACINKNSNLDICQDMLMTKENIEREVNRLLVQHLSISEKYASTAAYFIITQKVIFSWKIDEKVNVNLTYDFREQETKQLTFSYSF